jgi:hypothetical protein
VGKVGNYTGRPPDLGTICIITLIDSDMPGLEKGEEDAPVFADDEIVGPEKIEAPVGSGGEARRYESPTDLRPPRRVRCSQGRSTSARRLSMIPRYSRSFSSMPT